MSSRPRARDLGPSCVREDRPGRKARADPSLTLGMTLQRSLLERLSQLRRVSAPLSGGSLFDWLAEVSPGNALAWDAGTGQRPGGGRPRETLRPRHRERPESETARRGDTRSAGRIPHCRGERGTRPGLRRPGDSRPGAPLVRSPRVLGRSEAGRCGRAVSSRCGAISCRRCRPKSTRSSTVSTARRWDHTGRWTAGWSKTGTARSSFRSRNSRFRHSR